MGTNLSVFPRDLWKKLHSVFHSNKEDFFHVWFSEDASVLGLFIVPCFEELEALLEYSKFVINLRPRVWKMQSLSYLHHAVIKIKVTQIWIHILALLYMSSFTLEKISLFIYKMGLVISNSLKFQKLKGQLLENFT